MVSRNRDMTATGLFILLILVSSLSTATSHKLRFDGHKVLRIHVNNQDELGRLHGIADTGKYHVDYWNSPDVTPCDVDIHLSDKEAKEFTRELSVQKIQPRVLIDDVQRLIEMEEADSRKTSHPLADRLKRATVVPASITGRYGRLSEIRQWQSDLVKFMGDVVRLQTIGQSYEGRPLEVLKIGVPGVNKSEVWVDGATHAREWISPASVMFMVYQLLNGWINGRPLEKQILENLDLHVMVIVNPDGYEFSHTTDRLWRKNRRPHRGHRSLAGEPCVGTDLNRNFPFHWGGVGTSPNPCSHIYKGPHPASEPETKAVMKFVRSRGDNLKCFTTVHSYSQLWLTRWAYTTEAAKYHNETMALLKDTVEAVHSVYGTPYKYGPAPTVLYGYSGGSPDWARGELNVKHSYAVELRDRGYFGFTLPSNFVQPVGEELWAGMKVILTRIANESIANESQNEQKVPSVTSQDHTVSVTTSTVDPPVSSNLRRSSTRTEKRVTRDLNTKDGMTTPTSDSGAGSLATDKDINVSKSGPLLTVTRPRPSSRQPISGSSVVVSGSLTKLGATLCYLIYQLYVL